MKTDVVGSHSGALRSRWAAVGAAVAVTLGAGGMVAVNAAPSDPSSFVSITPTRILDTRSDVGLDGPFASGVSQTLQVTGPIPTQPPGDADPVTAKVVPPAATSVVFNVTVVAPQTKGFLSIRPGDATGTPATSNINWAAGGANIANAVTVQLPVLGDVNIFVNGTVGHVLIDVAGYNVPGSGAPGPQGDQGPEGEQGEQGEQGIQGPEGPGTAAFGTATQLANIGTAAVECILGEIGLTASRHGRNRLRADGQLLDIASNTTMYSLLGTTFGGNGRTTFALPDLTDAAPNGLTYTICTLGIFPSPL